MSWEQRLREMVLAGGAGAMAAVGCVDSSGSGAGADSGTDGVDASGLGADADSGADGNAGPVVNFCCNANGDPCCPSLYCDAMVTAECTQKTACESEGGTWEFGVQGGCARDAGAGDATSDAPEAAPSDSGAHGDGQPD